MTLGTIVALFADVHGEHANLRRALARCREEGVSTIALLGDLVDRTEQADACAVPLVGWHVVGVYGNHEREIALAAATGRVELHADTLRLLGGLAGRVVIDDVSFLHEAEHWGHGATLARLMPAAGAHGAPVDARITFAGHTHVRQARDERGPIDIARGRLTLDPRRRYLINPGALAIGQYAVWDRTTQIVQFHQV